MEDLGDLLHEIDRDRELDDAERAVLQDRLYRLIWERAQPRLRTGDDRPGHDGMEHSDSDGEGGGSLGG